MYGTLIERLLTQSQRALHAVELTLFLWRMPEGVAEHSFYAATISQLACPVTAFMFS